MVGVSGHGAYTARLAGGMDMACRASDVHDMVVVAVAERAAKAVPHVEVAEVAVEAVPPPWQSLEVGLKTMPLLWHHHVVARRCLTLLVAFRSPLAHLARALRADPEPYWR
jgi:hypothetical protein